MCKDYTLNKVQQYVAKQVIVVRYQGKAIIRIEPQRRRSIRAGQYRFILQIYKFPKNLFQELHYYKYMSR